MTADEGFSTGGLAGYNQGSIVDAYSTATVDGDKDVGGLVGRQQGYDGEDQGDEILEGKIENAYASGKVTGDGTAPGGLIGRQIASPPVTEGYWDSDSTEADDGIAIPDSGDVTSLATDDFAHDSNFGFDFDDIWKIGEAPDDEDRPILQWQP